MNDTESDMLATTTQLTSTEVESNENARDGHDSVPTVSPPQKRKRKKSGINSEIKTKKQVRGKQGGLKNIMTLPVEIVNMIAPQDLIVLSRVNKFFRSLLMRRSSASTWRNSLSNVPHLPPCPPDMCDPQFAALVFSKHCTLCGTVVRRRINTQLRVRMCAPCSSTNIIPAHMVNWEIRHLVPSSYVDSKTGRLRARNSIYLRRDVDFVTTKLIQLKASGDEEAVRRWKTERVQYLNDREIHAKALDDFYELSESSREEELDQLKTQRRVEVKSRLAALGWSDEQDFEFPLYSDSKRAWTALAEQPKALTERIWEHIRPKLICLLEENRERRLEEEKADRRRIRCSRLGRLFHKIQESMPPFAHMPQSARIDPPSVDDPMFRALAAENASVELVAPFPTLADVCQWEVLQDLVEEEILVDSIEDLFEQRRDEINQEISKWQVRVLEHFASLAMEEHQGETIPKPQIIEDLVDESFGNLSSSAAIVLRADSFYYLDDGHAKTPRSFGPTMAWYRLKKDTNEDPRDWFFGLVWLPSMFKLHSKARSIARSLLQDIGRPNASFLEFRGIRRFVCLRCNNLGLRTWEGIVKHYFREQENWSHIPKKIAKFAEVGITYNCAHDLTPSAEPFIKILSPEEADSVVKNSKSVPPQCRCLLCERAGEEYLSHQDCMVSHMKYVHGVPEPNLTDHYKSTVCSILIRRDNSLRGMECMDEEEVW